MASRKILPLLLMAIFSTIDVVSPAVIKAGYWPSWSASYCPPSAIDTSFFSHLFYAFVDMDYISYRLTFPPSDRLLVSNFTATMRCRNPPVKTLLSIGGGGANSTGLALMASEPSTRRVFIQSTISVARSYGFDGLDLDWEFPANRREMRDFSRLLAEWRLAVEKEACTTGRERLLLTAAVYFSPAFFLSITPRSYPATSIGSHLDWVNVMCYDYHGSWDTSATGAHAALFDSKSHVSTSFGIESWLHVGVPPEKVVIGLPLYGRTWNLTDGGVHGIGAPAIGVGPGKRGVLTYAQVVHFNEEKNATVVYDGSTVSTYSYAGTAWIGYDDEISVTEKLRFAGDRRLGGYFFWAISYDKDWRISRKASEVWIR